MIYRPRHFKLPELVDPRVFAERGERAWELLRPDGLMMLDHARDVFGPIVINGQFGGKTFTESGLRLFDTPTGARWSMHKWGGAWDMKFKACTPKDAFDYILAHPGEFPYITAMEDVSKTVTWLHADGRNGDWAGIKVFQP